MFAVLATVVGSSNSSCWWWWRNVFFEHSNDFIAQSHSNKNLQQWLGATLTWNIRCCGIEGRGGYYNNFLGTLSSCQEIEILKKSFLFFLPSSSPACTAGAGVAPRWPWWTPAGRRGTSPASGGANRNRRRGCCTGYTRPATLSSLKGLTGGRWGKEKDFFCQGFSKTGKAECVFLPLHWQNVLICKR